MTLDELKKDHIKSLTAMKEDFLVGVDINNTNEMVNLDGTALSRRNERVERLN